MHQYFDSDYSGKEETCVTTTKLEGDINFDELSEWMSDNRIDVILDEFGTPTGEPANCQSDVQTVLDHMQNNAATGDPSASALYQTIPADITSVGLYGITRLSGQAQILSQRRTIHHDRHLLEIFTKLT